MGNGGQCHITAWNLNMMLGASRLSFTAIEPDSGIRDLRMISMFIHLNHQRESGDKHLIGVGYVAQERAEYYLVDISQ
jgi:hypothetical protein